MSEVTFTVMRPLSLNRMYMRRRGGGKGLMLTPEGRAFKDRIGSQAMYARTIRHWPSNPWRVLKAELSYQLYDYRGDTDGPRKALRDACEQILYVRDNVVQDGPAPLAIFDGNGSRVVVTVTLLEECSEIAARLSQAKWEKARDGRLRAKLKRGAA
jgi:Holliday junction resolvase RusA-like endonuclease